jgi:hypothetical protein
VACSGSSSVIGAADARGGGQDAGTQVIVGGDASVDAGSDGAGGENSDVSAIPPGCPSESEGGPACASVTGEVLGRPFVAQDVAGLVGQTMFEGDTFQEVEVVVTTASGICGWLDTSRTGGYFRPPLKNNY